MEEKIKSSKKVIEKRESNIDFYNISKRLFDVTVSLLLLPIVLSITLILFSFYVFGENKGPMLFKQKRIGRYGKEFNIYKFRSMVIDAESKLKSNPLLYSKYLENNYKLEPKEDPRITRFGIFIRSTSLDELPQFLNVLKGDMSLVGPRPVVPEELNEYKDKVDQFLSVKPGITGYWQASGRSNIGYPDRVDIELYYIKNQNMKLDIEIIFNTFFKVLFKKGAY